MEIGGFQKLSLLDYPGYISCIVFTVGCNFRCPFCYVPQLVLPEEIRKVKRIPESYIVNWIERNREFIDAVVITGGEPTLQPDLPKFIREIREYGLKVAVETNGSNPDTIKKLVENRLIDYIAMDIKTRLEFKNIMLSLERLLQKKALKIF